MHTIVAKVKWVHVCNQLADHSGFHMDILPVSLCADIASELLMNCAIMIHEIR